MTLPAEELALCRRVVAQVVAQVDPDEQDVIDDGFDDLAKCGFVPPSRDPRHAFDIGDAWPYACVICASVGSVFVAALKDMAKDSFKRALAGWRQWDDPSDEPLSEKQIADMTATIDEAGVRLGVTQSERRKLVEDIQRLLRLHPNAALLNRED